MGMRLWIDDLRAPPDDTWIWAKSSNEARSLYLDLQFIEVSFDHDLGGDDTAMPIANMIEELAANGEAEPPIWHIHSANPVGRQNLKAALQSAERHWALHLGEQQ